MQSPFRRATLASLLLAVAAVAQTATEGSIELLGVVTYPLSPSASPIAAPQSSDTLVRLGPDRDLKAALARTAIAAPTAAALTNPDPAPKAVVRPNEEFTGFAGLTHRDNRLASNGNQFSLEPPDQGLAVGNGYVFEAVNTVLAIYSKKGVLEALPAALNAFFGLAPSVIRSTPPVYGPFLSDPRVYYDRQIQRWFLTVLELDVDSKTGAFTGPSHVLLAVSHTANPLGSYFLYSLNTTNGSGGLPGHPGCPCFGDQPLNGADENGFYVTTNEFPVFVNGFNGAQIYATSKRGLAAGTPGAVVAFSNIPLADNISYSIQPARSVHFGSHDVEYFLSALDFNSTLDNRIALWAITDTDTLSHKHPTLKLLSRVLSSETYGQPLVGAAQPPGSTPLGTLVGEPEETLNPNDDRMNQVVYENGLLWSGVNTVIGGKSTPVRNGIAYFVVAPSLNDSKLSGAIVQQGYVAAPGKDSVLFPSIGVSEESAAMTFTLVGPTASRTGTAYFPSMAFTRLNRFGGAGDIQLGAAGAAPEDGFSGYVSFGGGGIARWGDYSAATADEDGSIWMAAEWIPNSPRTTLANWGSFIGKLGE